jgi:hypothetical protein
MSTETYHGGNRELKLSLTFLFLNKVSLLAQTGLELVILLPQSPECWDYWGVPPVSKCEALSSKLSPTKK